MVSESCDPKFKWAVFGTEIYRISRKINTDVA
jgi:hypothetical protein